MNYWLLASVKPSPDCYSHLGSKPWMEYLSASASVTLPFKYINILKKKKNPNFVLEAPFIFLSSPFLKRFIQYFKELQKKKGLLIVGLLLKWMQRLGWATSSPEASFFQVSHVGIRGVRTWAIQLLYPDHQQTAELKVQQPGQDPALLIQNVSIAGSGFIHYGIMPGPGNPILKIYFFSYILSAFRIAIFYLFLLLIYHYY